MTNKKLSNTLTSIFIFLVFCSVLISQLGYSRGYKARKNESDHWECEYKWEGKNMDEMSAKCLKVMGVGSNLPDLDTSQEYEKGWSDGWDNQTDYWLCLNSGKAAVMKGAEGEMIDCVSEEEAEGTNFDILRDELPE